MKRPARPLLGRLAALALVATLVTPACVLIDRPVLALRSVAGGIHNRRRVSGIRPFFFPDGRLGIAANGGLVLQVERDGSLARIAGLEDEIDNPCVAPDGRTLVFVAGRDQITAGGGHNDHVFQIYTLDFATLEWTRWSASRRAESYPRYSASGDRIAFARRPDYDGWSLDDPWGAGAVFVARTDGSAERRLTEASYHPFRGIEFVDGDRTVVFAARTTGESFDVYAVAVPEGEAEPLAPPKLLIPNAYLPTRVDDGLLVVRALENGRAALALYDLNGEHVRDLGVESNEIGALAVAPDGERIVYSDFDPELGLFGEYRLWESTRGASEPVLLDTIEYRRPTRFKPGDLIKPPSWWFRSGASPGSR